MKFLVLAAIVAAILWWLRSQRQPNLPPTPGPAPAAKGEDMVACAVCGVHLPRSEALPGRGGLFCGEPHRRSFEQGSPPP